MKRPDAWREVRSDMLIALGLTVFFLALFLLGCWPLGKLALALSWAKGYGVYWLALVVSLLLLMGIEWVFRIDLDTHYTLYVGMNLVVSVVLVAGWAAFAAITLFDATTDEPFWVAALLYTIGVLASYLAFAITTAFYSGSIYKVVTLPLVLISYLIFAVWPGLAWALYGAVFALFGLAFG